MASETRLRYANPSLVPSPPRSFSMHERERSALKKIKEAGDEAMPSLVLKARHLQVALAPLQRLGLPEQAMGWLHLRFGICGGR